MMKQSHTLKVLITGDYCPVNITITNCQNRQFDKIYNDVLPVIQDKDVSIMNLECPLIDIMTPITKSGPILFAPTCCIEGIKYGDFDVAALANNHILDQGDRGIESTVKVCEVNGIRTVGAGMNALEASRTLFLETRNAVIAVINSTENEHSIATSSGAGANLLDDINMYYAIQEAKSKADYILLIVHSGNEKYHLPNPRMVDRFRFYADLGATAVIAHHSHVPTGYEIYNGVPIFYGLGNFIFDKKKPTYDYWHQGYICRLELEKSRVKKFDIIPYFQNKEHDGLKLMTGINQSTFNQRMKELSEIISDHNTLFENWIKYSTNKTNRKWYLRVLLNFNLIQQIAYRLKILNKKIINRNQLIKLLTLFRCDSLRDIIIKLIEKELDT